MLSYLEKIIHRLALYALRGPNLNKHKRAFKQKFPFSRMSPTNIFPLEKISVGHYTYGELTVHMWLNPKQFLSIGNCVSIAPNVLFIAGGNHRYNTISTYPFAVEANNWILDPKNSYHIEETRGPITVKDDVWIGSNSIILSGVTIGQGAIIAAGSVITKDVAPYSIVGGNPAREIKKRFDTNTIELLLKKADYSKINDEKIKLNQKLLNAPIENNNIDEILSIFR